MAEQSLRDRIVLDPDIMVGKPVIRGTRLTVEHILRLLGNGASIEEILAEYDGLAVEDIRACLLFAGETLADTTYMPLLPDMQSVRR